MKIINIQKVNFDQDNSYIYIYIYIYSLFFNTKYLDLLNIRISNILKNCQFFKDSFNIDGKNNKEYDYKKGKIYYVIYDIIIYLNLYFNFNFYFYFFR